MAQLRARGGQRHAQVVERLAHLRLEAVGQAAIRALPTLPGHADQARAGRDHGHMGVTVGAGIIETKRVEHGELTRCLLCVRGLHRTISLRDSNETAMIGLAGCKGGLDIAARLP